jgi:hypothetical protein
MSLRRWACGSEGRMAFTSAIGANASLKLVIGAQEKSF